MTTRQYMKLSMAKHERNHGQIWEEAATVLALTEYTDSDQWRGRTLTEIMEGN